MFSMDNNSGPDAGGGVEMSNGILAKSSLCSAIESRLSSIICFTIISVFSLMALPSNGLAGGAASDASGAQTQNGISVVVSGAMAYHFGTQCNPTPAGWVPCVLAGASAIQGGMSLDAMLNAGDAVDQLKAPDYNPGLGGTGQPALTSGDGAASGVGNLTVGQLKQQIAQTKKMLADKGVLIDGNNIKTPDGKSIPISAMSSEAGMKAAGFSKDDVENAKKLAGEAEAYAKKQVRALSMQGGDGGGGGGHGGSGAGGAGGGGSEIQFGNLFGNMNKRPVRKAASVQGMTKKLVDDNIGVAGDNMFDMVTRVYKEQDANNGFLKN
jgi:uncharacterized membrane protein YgcG